MKFHFEPNLDYQQTAIEAVCDLFRGQEVCRTEFTVTRDAVTSQRNLAYAQSDLGIGNRLQLLDDELGEAVTAVQLEDRAQVNVGLTCTRFHFHREIAGSQRAGWP